MRRCFILIFVQHCLLSRFVAVFIWFKLTNQCQSITHSINDLSVNIAALDTWIFRHFDFVIFVDIFPIYAINLIVVTLVVVTGKKNVPHTVVATTLFFPTNLVM